jgi:hypothetical protein
MPKPVTPQKARERATLSEKNQAHCLELTNIRRRNYGSNKERRTDRLRKLAAQYPDVTVQEFKTRY